MAEEIQFYLLPPSLELMKGDIFDSIEFEKNVDMTLKGNYYMVKEIINYLNQKGKGSLSLIHLDPNVDSPDYYKIMSSALKALYETQLACWSHTLNIRIFDASIDQKDNLIDFIDKSNQLRPEKNWGKWHRLKKGIIWNSNQRDWSRLTDLNILFYGSQRWFHLHRRGLKPLLFFIFKNHSDLSEHVNMEEVMIHFSKGRRMIQWPS